MGEQFSGCTEPGKQKQSEIQPSPSTVMCRDSAIGPGKGAKQMHQAKRDFCLTHRHTLLNSGIHCEKSVVGNLVTVLNITGHIHTNLSGAEGLLQQVRLPQYL